jgi:hypothetical protein
VLKVTDRFAMLCDHVQRAGSAVAAALLECESVASSVAADAGAAGDLAAISRNLLDAARLLDRAERLSYPIEPGGTQ